MPIWMRKSGSCLLAADTDAETALAKVRQGRMLRIHIDKVRSPEWNALYWKRCAVIGENLGLTKEAVDGKTRLMAGHKETAGEWEGRTLWLPARIAFDQLSAERWAEIWPSLEKAHEELCPGICEEIGGHW